MIHEEIGKALNMIRDIEADGKHLPSSDAMVATLAKAHAQITALSLKGDISDEPEASLVLSALHATPKVSGIYLIRNLLDGKVYIGSSVNIRKRWQSHHQLLCKNKHHSSHLQRAWNRDGSDYFIFQVIELCSPDVLVEREQFWFNAHSACDARYGYNIGLFADAPMRGRKMRPESIAKVVAAITGRKHPPGTGAKIAAALRGRKRPLSVMAGALAANTGRKATAETRAKMSAKRKGVPKSLEHRAKIAAAYARRRAAKGSPNGF